MGLKLFAATGYGRDFEYAVWAANRSEAIQFFRVPLREMSDQSTNKNLLAIITDRKQVYRRPLDDDNAKWEKQ